MKKSGFAALLFSILFAFGASGASAKTMTYEAKGKVTSVDPVYSRITIEHGAIKGFAGDEATEFVADPASLLKGIHKNDLVDFEIVDTNGDVRIDKLTRTGVATPEEGMKTGKFVQDVLVGTGEVAKGVTEPIAPAHDVVSGAVDTTTGATGQVLDNADNKVKKNF